jgi:hypothetical protein
MIAYRLTNGIAHDIRFVPPDYQAEPGETVIFGTDLPSVESLSDGNALAWREYQNRSKEALEKTSVTMERIAEAVAFGQTTWDAPDVVVFLQHRRDLRAILSQPKPDVIPDELPAHPGFPTGT